MELALYKNSGTENYEMPTRFLENLWTPDANDHGCLIGSSRQLDVLL